ncbi:MAG: FtsX-like permease family protein, partial [Bacteroidetes bacterium]|nr:FtsX-like permease family protein [Bacteroidota bacterium]
MVLIPLNNARKYYVAPNRSYFIAVSVADIVNMEGAIGEATGLFRTIRKLALKEESDFDIVKSDNLANELIENLSFLSGAATIIGFLTLLGAAIALMNILLVSVKERTREIGVSKAIGATSATIKWQFLVESIVICQIGGVLGILGGLLLGLVVAVALGGSFVIPWGWMISGVVICFVVGISAGMFPAIKASKLDPIVALRYE